MERIPVFNQSNNCQSTKKKKKSPHVFVPGLQLSN